MGPKEYVLFNQQYPSNWPAWLKLPEPCYLGSKGTIVPGHGGNSLVANCVVRMAESDVQKYFTDLLDQQAIQYKLDQIEGSSDINIDTNQARDNISQISIVIIRSEVLKGFTGKSTEGVVGIKVVVTF